MRTQTKKGFTVVELMVVSALLTIIMSALYLTLATGRAAWLDTDARIEVGTQLRQTVQKLSQELRQSGVDHTGASQVLIANDTGVNNSDVLTFSIPVVCQTDAPVMDNNSNVAHWGAPVTWGCTTSSCMDADDDCSTVDYAQVRYIINGQDQLLRQVLDAGGSVVHADVFATNIRDLQVVIDAAYTTVTLTITATRASHTQRAISATTSIVVFLRNRG